jgi:hypothetical protein
MIPPMYACWSPLPSFLGKQLVLACRLLSMYNEHADHASAAAACLWADSRLLLRAG